MKKTVWFILIILGLISQSADALEGIKAAPVIIENIGQLPNNDIKYYMPSFGKTVYFTNKDILLDIAAGKKERPDEKGKSITNCGRNTPAGVCMPTVVTIRTSLSGGNMKRVKGEQQTVTKVNYFKGSDSKKWLTGVKSFNEIVYKQVYPGIDLKYISQNDQLKYQFDVAASADPKKIRVKLSGINSLEKDSNGNLVINTAAGKLLDKKPYVYQEIGGQRALIASSFRIISDSEYSFNIGKYNKNHPLVIDPGLSFSTFIGGTLEDLTYTMTMDSSSNIYIAGNTTTTTASIFNIAGYDSVHNGSTDIVIIKLSPDGATILASTFLGGTLVDVPYGITLDGSNNVYITGTTLSTDFPTVSPYQAAYANGLGGTSNDMFISKLGPNLDTLNYSTYYGRGGDDLGASIVVDASGNMIAAGSSNSGCSSASPGNVDLPVGASYYLGVCTGTDNTKYDAYILKLNSSGSMVNATYFGSNGNDRGIKVALDTSGNVYVGGNTDSTSFLSGGFDDTYTISGTGTGNDIFIAKFDTTLTAVLTSTYLGGDAGEVFYSLALDSSNNVYITGNTTIDTVAPIYNFQTTVTSGPTLDKIVSSVQGYDNTHNGGNDLFVAMLNSDLSSLKYSTFIGGDLNETGVDIYLHDGYIYIAGASTSPSASGVSFPTTADAYQTASASVSVNDALLFKLNPMVSGPGGLLYSTYLGSTGSDVSRNLVVDNSGFAYVTGYTSSSGFPTLNAYDSTFGGGAFNDIFVTKFIMPVSIRNSSLPAGTKGSAYSQTLTANAGTSPYGSWTVTSGTLPAGLTLDTNTGVLSGTPTTYALSPNNVTIQVSDSSTPTALTASRIYNLIANPLPLVLTPATLTDGTVGAAYSKTFGATEGVTPYNSWIVWLESIPAGLTLNSSTGIMSGTPTAYGRFNFTLQVLDSNSPASGDTEPFTLFIYPTALSITDASPLTSGQINMAYSYTLSGTGGVTPYTWSITAGSLPPGMSINSSTGAISGTPTAYGIASFTAGLTDNALNLGAPIAANTSTSKAFTLEIVPTPMTITTASPLVQGQVGAAYSQTLALTGGAPTYTWSISLGSLPTGLSLNSSTGAITGTPGAGAYGTYNFTVLVTDSYTTPGTTSKAFSLEIIPATLAISTSSLPNSTVGSVYSQALAATGGATPYQLWTITVGSLPGGLTLNSSTGVISGTPNAGTYATFNFTAQVKDSYATQGTATKALTLVNNPAALVITTTTLPNATVDSAYSQTFAASGGATLSAYTWSLFSGTLPAGLTFNSAGVISGTPTAYGAYPFTVRVTDSLAVTDNQAVTLTVGPATLAITNTAGALSNGTAGTTYTAYTFNGYGGMTPYTWSVSAGAIPAGMALNSSTGVLSGTPTVYGANSFTIQLSDSNSPVTNVTKSFSIYVDPAAFSISTSSLSNSTVGTVYSQTLSAAGGVTPYQLWTVTVGSLPGGLTLNSSTGAISGTPNTGTYGTFNFTVQAKDSYTPQATATRALSLVNNPAALVISTTTLPNATVDSVYSQALAATGGASLSAYTWSLFSGTLPAGLTLTTSTGVISGTPTAYGPFTFTIRVTDINLVTANQSITITVNPAGLAIANTAGALSAGTVGTAYPYTFNGYGGKTPYTWSVSAGAIPAGLSLNSSTGVMSGTPATYGANSFTIQLSDGDTPVSTVTKSFTLYINPAAFSITTASLSNSTVGTVYNTTLLATGGVTPYQLWTVSVGTLPGGLTLNSSTGAISGTPNTGTYGTYNITVQVKDSYTPQATVTRALTLVVNPAALLITTTTLPNPIVDSAYSQTVVATGGATLSAYAWSIFSGTLPSGLSINSTTGVISGTPTAYGASTFTVRVADIYTTTDDQSITLTVNPAVLAITNTAGAVTNGTVGAAYSYTFNGYGGKTPYTWSVSLGSLPSGLSLNSSTGALTGTPTIYGTNSFNIQVSDSDTPVTTAAKSFSLYIDPAPFSITTTTLSNSAVSSAYSVTLAATGGVTPYQQWTVIANSLPGGLTLNSSTGVLSGTPNAGTYGAFTFTVQAKDSYSPQATTTRVLTLVNDPAPLTITTASPLTGGTVDSAYSQTLAASGGMTPYGTWTVSAGSLPLGLSLNISTGVLSGTPTLYGAYNFTVSAKDSNSPQATGSKTFDLTINPAVLAITNTPGAITVGTVSTVYSYTFTGYGGKTPYAWSVFSGTLPAGLTLNSSTGVLSGTPTAYNASGAFNSFTIQLSDGTTPTAVTTSTAFTLHINPATLVISTSSLPNSSVGSAYSQTLVVTGGATPYGSWTVTAGSLPGGLTLSSAGVLSGTPNPLTYGAFTFTAQVVDSYTPQATAIRSLTLVNDPAALSITTASPLTNGTVDSVYSQTLAASGGMIPYVNWSIFSGSLPAGLTLNASGVISGTPTTYTTASFTVRVQDSNTPQSTGSKSFNLTIDPAALAITNTAGSLANGTVGTAYTSYTFNGYGGKTPYTWSVSAGAIPTGLGLNSSTGVLSGTPTLYGTYNFNIQLSDNNTPVTNVTKSFSIFVNPAPFSITTSASLPGSQVATAYSQTIAATGGVAPYQQWTITSGSLPAGLSLNVSTGVISGTPNAGTYGTFNFTIQVKDSYTPQNITSRAFTLVNSPAPLTITNTSPLPNGTVGTAYSQTLNAAGGVTPFNTWTVITGSLPAGLSLNASTGVLSGTPTAYETQTFTVSVKDSNTPQATGSKTFDLTINPAALSITNTAGAITSGTVASAYSYTFNGQGGVTPYTFSVLSGAIPSGLSLNASTGVLSGTPTLYGTYSFTIQLADNNAAATTKAFTLSISPVPLSISTSASLPNGVVSSAYNYTLIAAGGVAPYGLWTVTIGTLPAGLSLNSSTGAITGAPTAYGTSSFTISVTDSYTPAATVSKAFTLVVDPAALVITTSGTLTTGTVGVAYNTTLAATGGITPYSQWTIASGTLPAGLTLNASTGVISGTPTAYTSQTGVIFNVSVKDANTPQTTANKNFTLIINPAPLVFTTASLTNGTVGAAYSYTFTGTGGKTPYSWYLYSGTLPAGLTLNSSTGVLSGTPTAYGSNNFTIQLSDGDSPTVSATAAFSLYIDPSPLFISTSSTLSTGQVGVAYSASLVAFGGVPPYSAWLVTIGSLPAGLSLNSSTGEISGTPSAYVTSASFTISVTDSYPTTVSKAFTLTITPAPLSVATISPLANGQVGVAYSNTMTAAGGVTPYGQWTIASGALPTGLTINSASGLISGTPTVYGASTFTLSVKDSNSPQSTATKSISLTINPAPLVFSAVTLSNGTVGTAYSYTFTGTGGKTPYAWSVSSGALPGGLSLNSSTGVLSGTPTLYGPYSFTILLTDGDSPASTASQPISLYINPGPMSINTVSPLSNSQVGTVYIQTITAIGGVSPYNTWSVISGSLPAGLTINSATGIISGTPTAYGSSSFTIQGKDSYTPQAIASKAFTMTTDPAPLTITTSAALTNGQVGVAYSRTLAATGGMTPYGQWAVTVGTLPTGLTINSATGIISGTPTAYTVPAGVTFTIRVKDSNTPQTTATKVFTLIIDPVTLAITNAGGALAAGTVGAAYPYTFTGTGGRTPYTWSVSSGNLPPGISLNTSTGILSGTPTTYNSPGVSDIFFIQIDDATTPTAATAAVSFSIHVNPAAMSISTGASLTNAQVGTAYSQTLAVTGGATLSAYTWSVLSGSLPAGITLDSNSGVLSGTPTAYGSSSFTIQAQDSYTPQAAASKGFTLITDPAPLVIDNAATLTPGAENIAYSTTLTVSGGKTPYGLWSITIGALPTGLSLNTATGVISGTPVAYATYSFTASISDNNSPVTTTTKSFTLVINPAALVVDVSGLSSRINGNIPLPAGQMDAPYSYTFGAAGGIGPYSSWTVISTAPNILPSGLTLNAATGVLSGTSPGFETKTFTIRVSDSDSPAVTATESFSLEITPDPLVIDTLSPLTNGQVGTAYTYNLSASGGKFPYAWAISSGTLPAGLSLNINDGSITGTPGAGTYGTYTFTGQVTDTYATPAVTTKSLTITIDPAPLVITTSSLTNAQAGVAYNQTMAADGGKTPYQQWTIISGSLPAGLSLAASTGIISGTPTLYGISSFIVQVKDSNTPQAATTKSITLTTIPAVLLINTTAPAASYVNVAYSYTFTGTGGITPYNSWIVLSGSLPTGLSLNNGTGVLSGTTTASYGTYNFTLQMKDSNSPQSTATQAFSLEVQPEPLAVGPTTLPNPKVGVAYSQTLTATGGVPGYSNWLVASGTLPTGLTFLNGVISGTPTIYGTSTFTISVKDSFTPQATANRTFTVITDPADLVITTASTLAASKVGVAYSATMAAAGGMTPYSQWGITVGSLPAGLTLNASTGVISGTPTEYITRTFTLRVKDANSPQTIATKNMSITSNPADLVISISGLGAPLPDTSIPLTAGTVGVAYTYTFTGTGGMTPYTAWTVIAGTLPAGLTLNSSTGSLSGTPSAHTPAAALFTVQLTDSNSPQTTTSRLFSLFISPAPLSISNTSPLTEGTAQSAYSVTLTAAGGVSPYGAWTVTTGALPAGLTLASSTGVISGTPTNYGTSTFTVRVEDSYTPVTTVTKALTLKINPKPLTISSISPLPGGQINTAYSQTLTVVEGIPPYVQWTIIAGSLPPGLTLNSGSGVLSGTPAAYGSAFSFTVQVKDSNSPQTTASKAFTMAVNPTPLAINVTSLPQPQGGYISLPGGAANASYSYSFAATGGAPPYAAWTVSGTLPAGLGLNSSTGVLSGTPTTYETRTFTITAGDSFSPQNSAAESFILVISAAPLVITTSTLPNGTDDAAYSSSISAIDGIAPYHSWSVISGNLPAGLAIDSSGNIAGTPLTYQTATFTIQVKDSSTPNSIVAKTFTIVIDPAPLAISTASLPSAKVGVPYNQTVTASGGVTPYVNWSATGLPAGLAIASATGVISGTPTVYGSPAVNIIVKDSNSPQTTSSKTFTLTIAPADLTVDTAGMTLSGGRYSMANGQINAPYTYAFNGYGGIPPYSSWTVSAGSIPPGVNLSAAGLLSGTPANYGVYNFTIQLRDSVSTVGSKDFRLDIKPEPLVIDISSFPQEYDSHRLLPGGEVGVAYTQWLSASGGVPNYGPWMLVSGSLPPGITMNTAGLISGAATSYGMFKFTVQVQDSYEVTTIMAQQFAIRITPEALRINTGTLPKLADNSIQLITTGAEAAYTYAIVAVGGISPYNAWSITAGALPPGLTLVPNTGVITGAATQPGKYVFTVQLTDNDIIPTTTSKTFTLTIKAAPFVWQLSSTELPTPKMGALTPYSYQPIVKGGYKPYKFKHKAGKLPPGAVLNTLTGVISGNPTKIGSYRFVIEVSDSSEPKQTMQKSLTAVVKIQDTDGDGISDLIEVGAGTNPNSKSSVPNTVGEDVRPTKGAPLVPVNANLKIQFSKVTTTGHTTITPIDVAYLAANNIPLPEKFTFGTILTGFEVQTNAKFRTAETCFAYDEANFQSEQKLSLMHYYGTGWADVTASLDVWKNRICGRVYSFSPFLIGVNNNLPEKREKKVTAVSLVSITANRTEAGILVNWITGSEMNNEGFNLLRSELPNGGFVKINSSIIPAAGRFNRGGNYQFVDTATNPDRQYFYRIEDIDRFGKTTQSALTAQIRRVLIGRAMPPGTDPNAETPSQNGAMPEMYGGIIPPYYSPRPGNMPDHMMNEGVNITNCGRISPAGVCMPTVIDNEAMNDGMNDGMDGMNDENGENAGGMNDSANDDMGDNAGNNEMPDMHRFRPDEMARMHEMERMRMREQNPDQTEEHVYNSMPNNESSDSNREYSKAQNTAQYGFQAARNEAETILKWTSDNSANLILGFNLLKSDKVDGEYVPINDKLIEPIGEEKNKYSYKDKTDGSQFYYKLEIVTSGQHKNIFAGPVH